jgi:hypothetical protein
MLAAKLIEPARLVVMTVSVSLASTSARQGKAG